MTRINGTRLITRETDVWDRGKPLVVTLHPTFVELRFKGTRQKYTDTYESMLWRASKRLADAARALKAEKRKQQAAARRKH